MAGLCTPAINITVTLRALDYEPETARQLIRRRKAMLLATPARARG